MSGGILFPPSPSPHQLRAGLHNMSNSNNSPMSTRKRKADDDLQDEPMNQPSLSPSPGPSTPARLPILRTRPIKKPRIGMVGGPLSLPRLLETLSPDQLRGVLRRICDQHPQIGNEIASAAPRPSVSSVLSILADYQSSLHDAFPYGNKPAADYAYNRVRQSLMDLLEALRDYTPHFLPPNESQPSISLEYLDGATNAIHQLPNWDTYQHNRHKHDAYDEMAQAWALVIREAAKKGGGIQLHHSGWLQKLERHDQESGGRLIAAVTELRSCVGWMDGAATGRLPDDNDETDSIRQQLLNGTYGTASPVQVGPW